MKTKSLTPYLWLSILAAIITISLKTTAYLITGSVGLLSDALESIVNLVAAISALFLLRLAEKPPDDDHVYGHNKAEYFSSVIEACLIIIAAVSIGATSIHRIINPRSIGMIDTGLIIAACASFINLFVALTLLRVGKKHNSITLEADGHHLLTDVWTSAGVIVGVGLVAITKIQILDPLIALLVALNIIVTGYKIIKQSALGLMDTSLHKKELDKITQILDSFKSRNIEFHGIKSRLSGTRKFVSFHVLVPGEWTVQESHDVLEEIETEIRRNFTLITVFTHLEPIEDPKSQKDIPIDRFS